MSVALEEVNGWLDDLWCLATGLLDGAGAKDTINSIENALPFYVEDQLAGLASQLLSPASDRSLPAILRRSLQDQSANHQIQRELRAEILRFFEVFLEESILNRNVPTLVAEYAAPIVEVCMDLFAGRETNNQIKELSVHPLLLCLGLKEHLPDPRSLSRLLFPPEDEHDRHGGGGKRRSVVDIYWGGFGLSRATSKTTPNVNGACLKLLGRAAFLFPVEASAESIFADGAPGGGAPGGGAPGGGSGGGPFYRCCMNKLREISGTRLAEAAGALEGLNGLMVEASLYTKRGAGTEQERGTRTHTHTKEGTQTVSWWSRVLS